MPYIAPEARLKFHLHADHGAEGIKLVADNAGELQYCIAVMIREYLNRIEKHGGRVRYQQLNDVLGALEGAKLEYYRRVMAGYENEKIRENDDVYDA